MAGRARIAVALLATTVLPSVVACGSDGRNTTDSPIGVTAVKPTADATGAVGPVLSNVKVRLQPVAKVSSPTALSARPGTADLYVTEQAGRVRRIEVAGSGDGRTFTLADGPVIDITGQVASGGERGLLGIAFSPDGDTLFLYYTAKNGAVTIDSYAMDGTAGDVSSRRNLISVPHERPNHNGGALVTGPDGMLYIGTGDGGGAGDPDGNGQRTDTLLARVLRIDPTGSANGKRYGIPADNPFADGKGGAAEVWSYGLRNPWRISFDRATGDLWIADVGQNEIEEINRARKSDGLGKGANYGWNLMEGTNEFTGPAPANHTPPVFEYDHEGGNCTVIGGYVYRGGALPSLRGAYLFGDLCAGKVIGLTVSDDGKTNEHREIGLSLPPTSLSSFGEDNEGEVYTLTLSGEISRISAG